MVSAPAPATAARPRIAPAIHHLAFRFILRARLSAGKRGFPGLRDELPKARDETHPAATDHPSLAVGHSANAAVEGDDRHDLDHVIEVVVVEVPVQVEAARLRAGR